MNTPFGARRVSKTWRSRECESDLQGGKTGGDQKMDLPESRSRDSRSAKPLVSPLPLASALA